MSKTLQEKEKIIITISGGNIAGVYSSISNKNIEVEVYDYDSRLARTTTEQYINQMVETGITPYTLY